MWKNRNEASLHNNLLIICVLIPLFFVTACGGLNRSDKPATTSWWLEPYTDYPITTPAEPVLALDLSLTVVPGLDSHKILILSDHAELKKYAGARWADSLPELVHSLVGRSLEASGRFTMVSTRGGAVDCDLKLELREFFANLGSSGKTTGVQVAIGGQYKCDGSAAIPVQVDAAVPVHDDRMAEIVAAFQQAVDSVMRDLLQQIQ